MNCGSPPSTKHALDSSRTSLGATPLPGAIVWHGTHSAEHVSGVSAPLHTPSPQVGCLPSDFSCSSVPSNLSTSTVFCGMPGRLTVELYWWNAHLVQCGGTSGHVAL